jgi:hypothetical protein
MGVLVVLTAAACRRQAVVTSAPTPPQSAPVGANTVGGANGRDAIQKLFAAAKAQDIQAMSVVWGTKNGPARDDRQNMTVEMMEQRLIYMARCLRHDTFAIRGETPIVGGDRQYTVELRFRNTVASEDFVTTPGPGGRWFVSRFDVAKLNTICTAQ